MCSWSIEASDLQLLWVDQENYKVVVKVFYFLDLDKVAKVEANKLPSSIWLA